MSAHYVCRFVHEAAVELLLLVRSSSVMCNMKRISKKLVMAVPWGTVNAVNAELTPVRYWTKRCCAVFIVH